MRRWAGSLALLFCISFADTSAAQPRRPAARPRPVPTSRIPVKGKTRRIPVKKKAPSDALSARQGVRLAQRQLTQSDPTQRVRALERLGKLATPVALDALEKALEPGGAARTSLERWTAVRALAPHAEKPVARLALARALGTSSDDPSDPIAELASRTAALALAQANNRDGLLLLGQALRQQGPAARAAMDALLAHPPRDMTPLLQARGAPTRTLIELLGQSGDQRAFHTLRAYVRRGAPEIRAAAAVELTRLGGFETVALARSWLKQDSLVLRHAALSILLRAGAPDGPLQVSKDLALPERAEFALALAADAPHPDMAPALIKLLSEKRHDAAELIAILGQTNADAAAQHLQTLLGGSDRAAAALALGQMPTAAARRALDEALAGTGAARRWALRAGALRAVQLGDAPASLGSVAEKLLPSPGVSDRAAAAWALAATNPRHAEELIHSKDEAVAATVARFASRAPLSVHACDRLSRETSARMRVALSSCLVDLGASAQVPSTLLNTLLDTGGVAAPLAARALASRDDARLRKKIEELLASNATTIRAHTVLGLAKSRAPSAVGLMHRLYYREPDQQTRYAIVFSLAQRPESVKRRVLRDAAALDPDLAVRGLARAALGGSRISPWPIGTGQIWAELSASSQPIAVRAVGVRAPTGLTLPLVSDPDGAVVALGFPEGMIEFETSREVLAPGDDSAQSGSTKKR